MLQEVSCFSEGGVEVRAEQIEVEVRAEQIEEGNNFSPKQVLTTPRPLKRTYAVAGQ
jgi:hypothetical protein